MYLLGNLAAWHANPMAIAGHNTKQIGLVIIISTSFKSNAYRKTHYILIIYFGQSSEIQKEGKGGKKMKKKKTTIVIDVNEKKRRKRDAEIEKGRKVVNAHATRLLDGRSGARIPAGVRDFSCLQIVQTGPEAPPIFLFSRYHGSFPERKRYGGVMLIYNLHPALRLTILYYIVYMQYIYMGTAVAQWLRCCATNLKVAGSIPASVSGIFHWHKILPIEQWPWGRLSL